MSSTGSAEIVLMIRILPHLIETQLLTPSTSIKLIDLLERILFPLDGYPAPTPPDPSSEEVKDMRIRIEKRLGGMLPSMLLVSPKYSAHTTQAH